MPVPSLTSSLSPIALACVVLVAHPAMTWAASDAQPVGRNEASMHDDAHARGVVLANGTATLTAGVSAPIAAMPVKAGASFKKGQTLLAFDCSRFQAELEGLEAGAEKRRVGLEQKQLLLAHQAAGAFEVEESRADLRQAQAEVTARRSMMRACTIRAPFDGRVVETTANPSEQPAQNAPLLTVQDTSRVEIELIVPSRWLQWLRVGTPFAFSVEETGRTLAARIDRLGARVDAVSQTIKVTGRLRDAATADVLPGMSGTAAFGSAAAGAAANARSTLTAHAAAANR